MPFEINNHLKLVKAVRANNLVVFIGAGLSFDLTNTDGNKIGGWKSLAQAIIDRFGNEEKKLNNLKELSADLEPIETLDLIQKLVKKSSSVDMRDIKLFIRKYLDLSPANPLSLHKKLAMLTDKIITTNYDKAMEVSCPELGQNVAYTGRNFELTTHRSNEPFLLKLHGCVSDMDSLVLFTDSYDRLYDRKERNAQHTLKVFENLIYNKKILFIGCGMGDFQINHLFNEVRYLEGENSEKHFVISKYPLNGPLDFLTPISVGSYDEIETIIDTLIKIRQEAALEKNREKLELQQQNELLKKELEQRGHHTEVIMELFNEAVAFYNEKEYEKAITKYRQITSLEDLKYFGIYNNWGTAIANLARVRNSEALYQDSFAKYDMAVRLDPTAATPHNNWGTAIYRLAKLKKDKVLFQSSYEQYAEAIRLKPDYSNAYSNWGNALYSEALIEPQNEALLYASFEKYADSVRINPADAFAYNNWGNAIYALAKFKQDPSLYKNSFEKYSRAAELDPANATTYNNWGNSIADLARLQKDEKLYRESFTKYISAAALGDADRITYYNWGNAVMELARLLDDPKLYQECIDLFQKAARLGAPSYNMACACALLKNKEKAMELLAYCLQHNEIKAGFAAADSDWDVYRSDPDFTQLLEKYLK